MDEERLTNDRAFAPYARDVREYLANTSALQAWPGCRNALLELTGGDEPWLLALPVLTCLAVGGAPGAGLPVAAAWAMLRHAANLLDAVQDGDPLPSAVADGPAKATSCAAGLIFAAFRLICSTGSRPDAAGKVAEICAQAGFDASLGQYLGLDLADQRALAEYDLENYWFIDGRWAVVHPHLVWAREMRLSCIYRITFPTCRIPPMRSRPVGLRRSKTPSSTPGCRASSHASTTSTTPSGARDV